MRLSAKRILSMHSDISNIPRLSYEEFIPPGALLSSLLVNILAAGLRRVCVFLAFHPTQADPMWGVEKVVGRLYYSLSVSCSVCMYWAPFPGEGGSLWISEGDEEWVGMVVDQL